MDVRIISKLTLFEIVTIKFHKEVLSQLSLDGCCRCSASCVNENWP